MPEVKSRKNVFVKTVLDATGQFDFVIHIPFHVHDMVATQWAAGVAFGGGAVPTSDPFIVEMLGVGEIVCFTQQDFDSPRHIYNLNRPVVGRHTFTVRNSAGAIINQTGCHLMFCLEFIEFVAPP
jgi:hypothetical protein